MLFSLYCTKINMQFQSQQVQQRIVDMQKPLSRELTEGVATFNQDVLKFDADYDAYGPMTPGLSARDASDRYRQLKRLLTFLACKIFIVLNRRIILVSAWSPRANWYFLVRSKNID